MKKLELYLHIPFCAKKCDYCDFLSAPAGRQEQEAYVHALEREILSFQDKGEYEVSTVFFGGGTPSLLLSAQIAGLMELLHREFHFSGSPEVTIECNPGTADEEKLRACRAAGINRLSIGLQSADDRELRLLGRIHTWERFLETYEAARRAGFSNINIDLMSALPGQTVDSWERTLDRVLALAPEHISAYSLIIEEGTPFYERYRADAKLRDQGEQPTLLPSEEDERRMYERTEELLGAAGLYRYEISNYARPGYECRHNIGYWTGEEYAGFGLGASSLLRICREKIPGRVNLCSGAEDDPGRTDLCSGAEDDPGRTDLCSGAEDDPGRTDLCSGIEDDPGRVNLCSGAEDDPGRTDLCSGAEDDPGRTDLCSGAGRASGRTDLCSGAGRGGRLPAVWLRQQNPADMTSYLAGDFSGRAITPLSEADRMEEFVFLGLRLTKGVSEAEFLRRFGIPMEEIYGRVIREQTALGLLNRSDGRVFLTARGRDLSNLVMAEFLL